MHPLRDSAWYTGLLCAFTAWWTYDTWANQDCEFSAYSTRFTVYLIEKLCLNWNSWVAALIPLVLTVGLLCATVELFQRRRQSDSSRDDQRVGSRGDRL